MRCSIVRRLISAYRDGALPESQRAAMAEHLDACESCRVELVRLNMALGTLGVLPLDEPTRSLHKRLMERVKAIESAREADVWDRALLDPQIRASAGLLPVDHEHGDPKGEVTISSAPRVRRRTRSMVATGVVMALLVALLVGMSAITDTQVETGPRTTSVAAAEIASADDPILSALLVEHHARMAEVARQARAVDDRARAEEAARLGTVLDGAGLQPIEAAIGRRLRDVRISDEEAVLAYLDSAAQLRSDAHTLQRQLTERTRAGGHVKGEPITIATRTDGFAAPMPPVALLSMIESREQAVRVVMVGDDVGAPDGQQAMVGTLQGWPSGPFELHVTRHDRTTSINGSDGEQEETITIEFSLNGPPLAERQYARAFTAYAAGRFDEAARAFATYRALPGRTACAELAAYWHAMALRRSGQPDAAWPILSHLASSGGLERLADPVDALLLLRAVHGEVTGLVTRESIAAPRTANAAWLPNVEAAGAIRFGSTADGASAEPFNMLIGTSAPANYFYPAVVQVHAGEWATATSQQFGNVAVEFVTTPTDTSRLGQFHLLERELLRVARAGDVNSLLGRLAPNGSIVVRSQTINGNAATSAYADALLIEFHAASDGNATAWSYPHGETVYATDAGQAIRIRRYQGAAGSNAITVEHDVWHADANAATNTANYGPAWAAADETLYYLDVLASLQGRPIAYEADLLELPAARWQLQVEPASGGSGLWAYGPWAREGATGAGVALEDAMYALQIADLQTETVRLHGAARALNSAVTTAQTLSQGDLSDDERQLARDQRARAEAMLEQYLAERAESAPPVEDQPQQQEATPRQR